MDNNKKLKDAIKLVKFLNEEENEELEINWLETTDEYVINKGNCIIMDGLEENEAYIYLDILESYNQ